MSTIRINMDSAGELGTFLNGGVLLIDVPSCHDSEDAFSDSHPYSAAAFEGHCAPCPYSLSSEDEASASAYQTSTGSLSHTSLAGLEHDVFESDHSHVFKRLKSSQFSSLGFEVDSSPSMAHATLGIATPTGTDALASSFASAKDFSVDSHLFGAAVGLPFVCGPDGIALGVPCVADVSMLLPQHPINFAWHPEQPLAKPSLPGFSSDRAQSSLHDVLRDVLAGKLKSPPLGLKLDIGAVVREMRAVDR